MTISRAEIAGYLATQFSSLAAAVGQTDSDASATGYGPDIDNALRRLGKSRSELDNATVEDSQEEAVLTLAEYYAARRFWRRLGDRVNHTMGETRYDFDGQRKSAKEMMEAAASECAALGYDVANIGWSSGYLNLDYLEPEIAE